MPPPATRDLLVTGAVQAQIELLRAIATEDQMRVAIDQSRRDQRTVERFNLDANVLGAAGNASMRPIQATRPLCSAMAPRSIKPHGDSQPAHWQTLPAWHSAAVDPSVTRSCFTTP
jgi:hypothetical protein